MTIKLRREGGKINYYKVKDLSEQDMEGNPKKLPKLTLGLLV
jgi:hypothetical protein